MKKGDVEDDGVDEWEPIRLSQVCATAIQGAEELKHQTRFKEIESRDITLFQRIYLKRS
jgi:hypothetical protein